VTSEAGAACLATLLGDPVPVYKLGDLQVLPMAHTMYVCMYVCMYVVFV